MDTLLNYGLAPTMSPSPEIEWLTRWRDGGSGMENALRRFDGLDALEPEDMTGRWRGAGLRTGHPLDGVLEALGWYGKAFEGPDRVHPLLFRRRSGGFISLDPALMPAAFALRWPGFARSGAARWAFDAVRPVLRTRGSAARLKMLEFRGKLSAAMIYDRQPIIDHFRRIDENRALGLMERRGMPSPYFFLLVRE